MIFEFNEARRKLQQGGIAVCDNVLRVECVDVGFRRRNWRAGV